MWGCTRASSISGVAICQSATSPLRDSLTPLRALALLTMTNFSVGKVTGYVPYLGYCTILMVSRELGIALAVLWAQTADQLGVDTKNDYPKVRNLPLSPLL
jgi:hypothetical protein